jgi:hypothetical protein
LRLEGKNRKDSDKLLSKRLNKTDLPENKESLNLLLRLNNAARTKRLEPLLPELNGRGRLPKLEPPLS